MLKTDVGYQRFRGYVSFTNDGRTVWFNNLNANEAVDLYARQGQPSLQSGGDDGE